MALGIVLSMFTALVITKVIVYSFYAIGIRNPKVYGRVKEERKPINFLGKKKFFFTISIALIVLGFVAIGVNEGKGNGALNYSLEFMGGTSSTVTFDKDYTLEAGDIIYLKSKKKKASKPHTVYIVKDGDSMHTISQKYGIRLKNLYKMNRKDDEYIPEVGDRLRLR